MQKKRKHSSQFMTYSIAKLINSLGNLVFPLITLIFLKTFHMDTATIGISIMIVTLSIIPGTVLGGQLCDRLSSKLMIGIPYLIQGTLMIVCIFVNNYVIFICLLIVAKFLSGITSPANTKFLTELCNDKNKKDAFSLIYWIKNFGTAICLLIAGILFSISYKIIFIIDGLTRIVCAVLILTIPLSYNKDDTNVVLKENKQSFDFLHYIRGRSYLIKYILITLIFTGVYSQYSYAIPLKLDVNFGERSSQIYSLVLACNCIVVIFFTKLINAILNKKSSVKCISISFLFLAIGFAILGFKCNIVLLIFSTIIWTTGEIIFGTNEVLYLVNNVSTEYIGRCMGYYDATHNFTIAISAMLNGFIIKAVGLSRSWVILVAIAVLGYIVSGKFSRDSYEKSVN